MRLEYGRRFYFNMENIEVWKDIEGYENKYQVSSFGNVKSLNYNHSGFEKLLKKHLSKGGYFTVALHKEGKQKTTKICKLVAIAFLNHTPCGFKTVIDHIDNNKLNDKLENLQLVSNRYNSTKDKTNKTGHNNIYKSKNQFEVAFYIKDKTVRFGRFNDLNDAIKRRNEILKTILNN
jgi:hypothetical protein